MSIQEFSDTHLALGAFDGQIAPEFTSRDLAGSDIGALDYLGGCELGSLEDNLGVFYTAAMISATRNIGEREPMKPSSAPPPSKVVAPIPASMTLTRQVASPLHSVFNKQRVAALPPNTKKTAPFSKTKTLIESKKVTKEVPGSANLSPLAKMAVSVAVKVDKNFDVTKIPSISVPPEYANKAKELARGGFIGGVIGQKGKALQKSVLKSVAEAMKANETAKTAPVGDAGLLRTKANELMAKAAVDRIRIDRLRAASTLKFYELLKKREAKDKEQKAAVAGGMSRYRLEKEAAQAKTLAKKSAAAISDLLAQPMSVTGLSTFVRAASERVTIRDDIKARTGKDFPKIQPPRLPFARGREAGVPQIRSIQQVPAYNVNRRATASILGGFDGLEGYLPNKESVVNKLGSAAREATAEALVKGDTGEALLFIGAAKAVEAASGGESKKSAASKSSASKKSSMKSTLKVIDVRYTKNPAMDKTLIIAVRLNKGADAVGIQTSTSADGVQQYAIHAAGSPLAGTTTRSVKTSRGIMGIKDSTWIVFSFTANPPYSHSVAVVDTDGNLRGDGFESGKAVKVSDVDAANKRNDPPRKADGVNVPIKSGEATPDVPLVEGDEGVPMWAWIAGGVAAAAGIGVGVMAVKKIGPFAGVDAYEDLGLIGSSCGCGK